MSADSQLNVTVGGKLDALKRAVDLMDESTIKLDYFTQNMKKTDEKIEAVNTTISNFEHLKRVSFTHILSSSLSPYSIIFLPRFITFAII